MADTYASMTDLEAATIQGTDWSITTIDNDNPVLISGLHGGGIEIGVTEASTIVAEKGGYDLFLFEGLRSTNNAALHVTGTNYNDPTMVNMVTNAMQNVTIHGSSGDTPLIYVGGLDFALRNAIWEELVKKGFNVQIGTSGIIGEEPNNIINRTRRGAGVTLELSSQQRKDFFLNGDWSKSIRTNRANWTNTLYSFADAVVAGIEQAKTTYSLDRYTSYLMDFNNNLSISGNDEISRVDPEDRRVHVRLSLTNGAPTTTYREGSEFVDSIVSDANGIRINFKNLPLGVIPFMELNVVSSGGIKTTAGLYVNYQYMREYNYSYLLIGLKEASSSNTHIPMTDIASGVMELRIKL